MAQQKKFGTFSGVFTPSILTILGVIMYMRLPWIVGQAGFFLTAGIILVAHLVSVSTGLSVSSIATDKKVKAGGTYYIISRSLGLPIGGTLGIALFFGLSLSVSLYLIGFSESFLGLWEFEITKDTIRLTGTIALVLVGTLTFISTSLAIKTQYFIMAAIGLSLVTILFGSSAYIPAEPLLKPVSDMSPLILLFAIFFPAVTGFEAGVSMSGDLQDAKKSIPVGTISAITVGLLVYLGMAAFFAYRVNADQLLNNPNILLDLSFFPPLLVAGIWGATLSSAIGSILGAPRILQATSVDRITPGIFAKGYGKTNEPRNALIFTFIIAEAGILIGELNLIARVVSMFFITTYGFLNLSSSLETWASTDFRPSFKIPAVVSIIGAIVCFILMLELDFIALIGAILIMGTIFFFLKKKELTLESGDTWEGVWASVLRYGLDRLNRIVKQPRNWRPNIILFSGRSEARPHLLQFGSWLVYKRGILSNFNLIENKESSPLIRKVATADEPLSDKFHGIFTRSMEVNELYEGMGTITKVYGFAGIEPNSVMLGWARKTKKPEKFSGFLRMLNQQDYNILVIDYDQERGYGENKVIDFWWRGGSNNIALGLTLIKFLLSSDDWEDAEARILLVNNDSSLNNRIYRNINQVLEEHRIKAQIKIINNTIDRKPIHDIIRIESTETDLVIMGLPEIREENARQYIESTDKLIDTLGSVLLISASSFFKPISIGIEMEGDAAQVSAVPESSSSDKSVISPLVMPEDGAAATFMLNLKENFEHVFNQFESDILTHFFALNTSLLEKFDVLIKKNYEELDEVLSHKEIHRSKKVLAKLKSNFLFNAGRMLKEYQEGSLPEQKENLNAGIQNLMQSLQEIKSSTPAELIIFRDKIYTGKKSAWLNIWQKIRRRQNITKQKNKIHVPLLIETAQREINEKIIYKLLQRLALNNYKLFADLQKLFTAAADSLLLLEKSLDKSRAENKLMQEEHQQIIEKLQSINTSAQTDSQQLSMEMKQNLQIVLQNVSNRLQAVNPTREIRKRMKEYKIRKIGDIPLTEISAVWMEKQRLVNNFFVEEIYIKKFQNRVETILEKFFNEIERSIDTNFIDKLNEISASLKSLKGSEKETFTMPLISYNPQQYRTLFEDLLRDVQLATADLPENLETITEESYQRLEEEPFGESSSLQVNLRRYLEFLVETEIFDPLQIKISELDQSLPKVIDVAQEVIRFTNHNLSLADEDEDTTGESISVVIRSGLERISHEKEVLVENQKRLNEEFDSILSTTFDKMNPYLISRSAGELKQTIRTKESREIISRITGLNIKIKSWMKNLMVRLIYQRSESVLFAKKLGKISTGYQTETGHIVEAVSDLSPDNEVLRKLPLYYSQLFVDKRMVSKEFLVDRKREMIWAAETLDTYRQGYRGALLVIGDRFAGKSTLSHRIASEHFDRQKIFHVFAAEGGSIDPALLKNQLADVVQRRGNMALMMNTVPQQSVMIFHDLELWWERSKGGLVIIDDILDLCHQYSDHCFFIVNISSASYKFINNIKPIENAFINVIECQPFDSEEIKESIMLRHRSTGLKFELRGQKEENISNLQLARLFNKYFDISGGNIGQAMYYWMSNITKVEPRLLRIKTPVSFSIHNLNKLSMEWLVLLQQFVLHYQLTPDRLERILSTGQNEVDQSIQFLKRCGLIQEFPKGILRISPYVQPVVYKRLEEMGMV